MRPLKFKDLTQPGFYWAVTPTSCISEMVLLQGAAPMLRILAVQSRVVGCGPDIRKKDGETYKSHDFYPIPSAQELDNLPEIPSPEDIQEFQEAQQIAAQEGAGPGLMLAKLAQLMVRDEKGTREVAGTLNITKQAAKDAIKRLVDVGVLTPTMEPEVYGPGPNYASLLGGVGEDGELPRGPQALR